ncbi:MAG: hypothetical protein WD871_10245 [Xanthobacteraceae bacterium]
MRAPLIFIAATVLALIAPRAAAAATCEVYRQPLPFATDTDVEMIVLTGKDCRVRFADDEIFEIASNEVTARPRYGGVRAQGNATAYYRSNPGFKGRDRFTFTLCGTDDGKAGCTNVRVRVLVR